MKQLGLDFIVCPADVSEEHLPEESTSEYVVRLSSDKALKIQQSYPDAIVIGGDTIVWTGEEILGKPDDEKQALEMLLHLSGRTHRVFSGLAVALPSGQIV
ncbi:MAG TPA: septum formation inhibitor Maf, partial [Gemmatimonadetes bacterium]|nr:septum formation inhibitor Maf [Gemmatimonadota bacterium]